MQEFLGNRRLGKISAFKGHCSLFQLAAFQNFYAAIILLMNNHTNSHNHADDQVVSWYKEATAANAPESCAEHACQKYHRFFNDSQKYSELEDIVATLKEQSSIMAFDTIWMDMEARANFGDDDLVQEVLNNISAKHDCTAHYLPSKYDPFGSLAKMADKDEDSNIDPADNVYNDYGEGESKEEEEEGDATARTDSVSDDEPEDDAEHGSENGESECDSQGNDDKYDSDDPYLEVKKDKRNPIKALYFGLLGAEPRVKMESPSADLARRIACWLKTDHEPEET